MINDIWVSRKIVQLKRAYARAKIQRHVSLF
jgi:hypothetical protein